MTFLSLFYIYFFRTYTQIGETTEKNGLNKKVFFSGHVSIFTICLKKNTFFSARGSTPPPGPDRGNVS